MLSVASVPCFSREKDVWTHHSKGARKIKIFVSYVNVH